MDYSSSVRNSRNLLIASAVRPAPAFSAHLHLKWAGPGTGSRMSWRRPQKGELFAAYYYHHYNREKSKQNTRKKSKSEKTRNYVNGTVFMDDFVFILNLTCRQRSNFNHKNGHSVSVLLSPSLFIWWMQRKSKRGGIWNRAILMSSA